MGRKLTGSIRKRGDRFEVSVGGEYFGIYDDLDKAERMKRAEIAERSGSAPESARLFASDWIDKRELAARKRKRSRSFKRERSRWDLHVATAKFWDLPWKRFTPKAMQEWVGDLVRKEAVRVVRAQGTVKRVGTGRRLSRRVIEDALSLLKLCLDDAVIAGKFAWCNNQNPARLVKLPIKDGPQHEGDLIVHMWAEEIDQLLSLDLPPFQRAVFTVAIYAGLRLEELWGLRWQDVWLTGKRPAIAIRATYNGDPVKTKTSVRDVPLLPPAVAALKAWKATYATTPIAGLVFPRKDGRSHDEFYVAGWRDKPRRVMQADGAIELRVTPGWRTKAGIRPELAFQHLRHTCGCHLLQGTWTPRPLTISEVSRWLGHSSIDVTERRYAALTSNNLHNAVDGAAAAWSIGANKAEI